MSVYHNMMTDDQKLDGLKANHAILSKPSSLAAMPGSVDMWLVKRPTWGGGELIVAAFFSEQMAQDFKAAGLHRVNDSIIKASVTINPPNEKS